jgi:hypothetical protein
LGEFVAGGRRNQEIETLIESHECDVVGLPGCRQHGLRDFGEFTALVRSGALASEVRHQALQLAPDLEQPQLQVKLISETMIPRRGMITTRPSLASRCSASRIGVRPIFKRSESACSDVPGDNCSVTIISSSSR